MDDGSLSSFTLILVLIAAHALVAMAYAALTASPTAYLREETDEGNPRVKRVLRLNDNIPLLTITAQLTMVLLRVAIVAIATVTVKNPLLDLPADMRALVVPPLSYGIVLLPLALLVYLVGDLMPSAIGRTRARTLAPVLALPMRVLTFLLNPLARMLLVADRALARVAGGSDIAKTVTDEEILSLVDVGQLGGAIEREEKEMIRSVLEFGETIVREIMVPRLDVVALDMDSSLDEALGAIVDSGHSRIPIYEEKIDNVKGVLYAKDLLHVVRSGELAQRTIRDLMRPAYFVPETKGADTLFKEMQGRKVHLAIVVDEYGGTAGLVSIEDLIEEIVGDIQDEYDLHEEAEYIELSANEYRIDASINLDDFNDLMNANLSTEDNDTLGGYIFAQLGRVPEPGETLDVADGEDRLMMRVESVEGRRIRKVHVTRIHSEPTNGETQEAANGARPAKPEPDIGTELTPGRLPSG